LLSLPLCFSEKIRCKCPWFRAVQSQLLAPIDCERETQLKHQPKGTSSHSVHHTFEKPLPKSSRQIRQIAGIPVVYRHMMTECRDLGNSSVSQQPRWEPVVFCEPMGCSGSKRYNKKRACFQITFCSNNHSTCVFVGALHQISVNLCRFVIRMELCIGALSNQSQKRVSP